MRKRHTKYGDREKIYGLLFASPGIIFFGMFYIWPMGQAIYMSFCRWNIISIPQWTGWENFAKLLSSEEFYNSLRASLYYSFGTAIPIWFVALGLAVLFNRTFTGRKIYLVLFYLPVVIPLIVWSILWKIMYHPTYGLLTIITDPLGFTNISWLTSKQLAMPSMIILSIWKGTPYYAVIYLAGLASVPKEYVEAARVDGASNIQAFLHIVLPLLKPIIAFIVVISLINAFQVFDIFYAMTAGGPGSATRVMPYFIYQSAFYNLEMGYACAASIIFFLLMFVLSFVTLQILKPARK